MEIKINQVHTENNKEWTKCDSENVWNLAGWLKQQQQQQQNNKQPTNLYTWI